jgi:hypothetical protein
MALNLHTVENISLERELLGSYTPVCLNLDYKLILVESGTSPRLGAMSLIPRKKSCDHNISSQDRRKAMGVGLLLIELLFEELCGDLGSRAQTHQHKPRVQVWSALNLRVRVAFSLEESTMWSLWEAPRKIVRT